MKSTRFWSNYSPAFALLVLMGPLAACFIAPPHDDRLDVPRGGEFPIDLTGDAKSAWLFTYENVIRDHEQSPYAALYEIGAEGKTIRREYRTRAVETSGIIPPSVGGTLSLDTPVPAFLGFGEIFYTASFLEFTPAGAVKEAAATGEFFVPGALPMNPTAQITRTPFQETWYWIRSMGNNADFPEQGWPPVVDSGPLILRDTGETLSTKVVYAGCIDGICRTVVREDGMLFVYGAVKSNPFANAITAFSEAPAYERVGFYAVCGTPQGQVLFTSQASYSFAVSSITGNPLPTAVRKLFSQPGSLQCGYPSGGNQFLWFYPDGRFAVVTWPEGQLVEGDLQLRKVPQEGKRYDHTRFRALRLTDGWLVGAGVLVETKEGNGCNNYEYCRAAFNIFDTFVFFINDDGAQVWKMKAE